MTYAIYLPDGSVDTKGPEEVPLVFDTEEEAERYLLEDLPLYEGQYVGAYPFEAWVVQ